METPLQCESEWSEVFNELDVDGDGIISCEDLKQTLLHLRLKFTEGDVQEMVGSGMSLDEFLKIVM